MHRLQEITSLLKKSGGVFVERERGGDGKGENLPSAGSHNAKPGPGWSQESGLPHAQQRAGYWSHHLLPSSMYISTEVRLAVEAGLQLWCCKMGCRQSCLTPEQQHLTDNHFQQGWEHLWLWYLQGSQKQLPGTIKYSETL